MNEHFFLKFHMARSHIKMQHCLFCIIFGSCYRLQVQQLKGGNSEEVPGAEADSAHEDGDILQVSREDVEVPAEAVLDSGGDFVDQTWDVVGEGAVDDDDVRVEGVENRVQADSDVVGEILHYFAGVGAAFLGILAEAFDGDVF